MKKLILSSLLFVSLIGVGAGAYIINGSYSPLNTAINVELGDKFGYELVIDYERADLAPSYGNYDFIFNPCTDKEYVIGAIVEDSTVPSISFSELVYIGEDRYFTGFQTITSSQLQVQSIEFDLADKSLTSIASYVSITGYSESSVGYFTPNTATSDLTIDVLQSFQVNTIIITLGI